MNPRPKTQPADLTAIMRLAGTKLSSRSPEAATLFAGITNDHDIREAWLGLAAAHHQQGQAESAAKALGHALSHHALDTGSNFVRSANAMAMAARLPGWCALQRGASLIVSLTRALSPADRLSAVLDDQPIALHPLSNRRTFSGRLNEGWGRFGRLVVQLNQTDLLGSPLQLRAIARVEGFVDSRDGDLHGWAWCPHDPDRDPVLSIEPLSGGPLLTVVADDTSIVVSHRTPMSRPRGFCIPATRLCGIDGPLRVVGHDRRNLIGSPIDPSAERRSAAMTSGIVARLFPTLEQPSDMTPVIPMSSVPADIVGLAPLAGKRKRGVAVIVPVYNGLDLALACLGSVLDDLPRWARVIVVDDGSPDPRVAEELEKLRVRQRVTLLTQKVNRGFPGAVNIGMRHDPTRDVVLLNSDTLVPPGWLDRLRDAAYSASAIGTVTPLSNDATIVSYPSVDHPNPVPPSNEMQHLDALAQRANRGCVVDIPTAVGFCVYIKRDCLNATGLFREDQFAQGYGEENDFCIRARHLGWRHVAAPDVFVAHVGNHSFGAGKQYLIERNLRLLNRLHPGYDALIRDFRNTDPLAGPRRRLDIERWKALRGSQDSVLLVTHGRDGGVRRHIAERVIALRAQGLRPIVLSPAASPNGTGRDCVLSDGEGGMTPNLRFAIPGELAMLTRLLKGDHPVRAEVHHLIGHDHAIFDLFSRLGIQYEIVIHDYSWFCPRINLVGTGRRYCGEPALTRCEACIADNGTTNDENTAPAALRARSEIEFAAASRVVTPTFDTATRIRRHFPALRPEILPWEDDSKLPPMVQSPATGDGVRRICVVGSIGIEKGFEILLACARDIAERKLNLEFRLVGHSCDDARLLATGCVHVTGRYEEHEAVSLIRAQQTQLAWLTSIWPETWSYTLSQAWQSGLKVLAFDLGAPAERIRRTGRGWLAPLGLPATALTDLLLKLQ